MGCCVRPPLGSPPVWGASNHHRGASVPGQCMRVTACTLARHARSTAGDVALCTSKHHLAQCTHLKAMHVKFPAPTHSIDHNCVIYLSNAPRCACTRAVSMVGCTQAAAHPAGWCSASGRHALLQPCRCNIATEFTMLAADTSVHAT